MFPTGVLKSADVAMLVFYLAVLGLLLLAGIILRVKISILKKYYLPASLIGGAIGVILGRECLGLLPGDMTSTFAALPASLIVIVFAPLLMCTDFGGASVKRMKDIAIPQLIAGTIGSTLQIGIPCLLTAFLFMPVFGVNPIFPSIVEAGWAGGHGTAAGMAEVYQNLGWEEGPSLGLTSATIGLLVGIIGGMIIINHGARKGYLSPKNKSMTLSLATSEDFTDINNSKANAYKTIDSTIAESFAFHATLIGVAILIGYVIKYLLGFVVEGLPLFPMAMLGGLIVKQILKAFGVSKYVDANTMHRIQGISLDFLVVAAISSIKLEAIANNIYPVAIVSIASLFSMLFFFYYICPRLFKEDWFEQGILHFGVNTAVSAVGFMLLRTVDPELNTISSKAYALQAPITSPLFGGGLVTSILPLMIVTYGNVKVGLVSLGITILLLLIAKFTGVWHKPQKVVNTSDLSKAM